MTNAQGRPRLHCSQYTKERRWHGCAVFSQDRNQVPGALLATEEGRLLDRQKTVSIGRLIQW